jgi:hypothetical protein
VRPGYVCPYFAGTGLCFVNLEALNCAHLCSFELKKAGMGAVLCNGGGITRQKTLFDVKYTIRMYPMDKNMLIAEITNFVNTGNNYVSENIALEPDMAGLKIFDEPLVGFANAESPLFNKLKDNDVIGSNFILPKEWNDEAKTVISIFFPFSRQIKDSNKENMDWPSFGWFHGRIEGQKIIDELCKYITVYLEDKGHKTIAPGIDSRFSSKSPFTADKNNQQYYTSNWSERHIAYICGLGTFGLSKGIITSRGVAGRFGSLITGAYFEPDKYSYNEIYEHCIFLRQMC